jgi:hypothetical protein
MTPNPHRGSDFADFLAEEGLTPTMKPTKDLPAQLRGYNAWRRGYQISKQPHPIDIGKMIDAAADRLEELERQLEAQRTLADSLAHVLFDLSFEYRPMKAKSAFDAWKEARRDS